MERKIITTGDGSKTIQLTEWDEQYHSKHGAIQEAYHVFIKQGLHYYNANHKKLETFSILEIGFGTGLNAFITLLEAENLNTSINYVGVEAYPVGLNEVQELNYPQQLLVEARSKTFNKMHEVSWADKHTMTVSFSLTKQQKLFKDISEINVFDLIYFDAFGARVQPELWTESIFNIMFNALKRHGVLVTYSAKGSVRRAMQAVGFNVERLPGPPGKREMLRATKV